MVQGALIKEKGISYLGGIKADEILSLLKTKHSNDVFVPECKNGETWGARDLLKIDAWVLRRSYSPLETIGYEIKTSRRDFEQDQKWISYLDLCHSFYFVCPAGLIRTVEIPQRVGLIWVSGSRKLHTKKKAQIIEPDADKIVRLLIYVLMSRSQIVANMFEVNAPLVQDRLAIIREATEKAKERGELAEFVRGHIRETYNQAMKELRNIRNREEEVKKFEDKLALLGIKWDSEKDDWREMMRVENEIDMLLKRIDWHTLEQMKRLSANLTEVIKSVERYRDGKYLG